MLTMPKGNCAAMRSGLIRSIMLLTLVCLTSAAHAAAIFKFKDAEGVWHYSDKNPGGRQSVEILQLYGSTPAQQRTVFVEKRGDATHPQLVVVNKNYGPVEVQLQLTGLDNVRAVSVPTRVLIPGRRERQIVALEPATAGKPLRYDYQLRWQLGDPDAKPVDMAYQPPVPERGSFPVSQGFNGNYSHFTEGNRYALDIAMPTGTAVRAARGGLVVSVQDGNNGGGESPSYRGQTNSIYVLHDDGTFGVYAHLRQRSAVVEPGLRVRTGQIIAQSGNTGYSTGPHLHFAVLRNAGLKWQSVPFKVALASGVVTPEKGLVLSNDKTTPEVALRDTAAAWGSPNQ
jgi:murein DD-endopeptidase MepM/ murein hydrolase activator NlpD